MSFEKNDAIIQKLVEDLRNDAIIQKLVEDLRKQFSLDTLLHQESIILLPSRRETEEITITTAAILALAPDTTISIFSKSGRKAAAKLEIVKKILAEEKNRR